MYYVKLLQMYVVYTVTVFAILTLRLVMSSIHYTYIYFFSFLCTTIFCLVNKSCVLARVDARFPYKEGTSGQ